MSKHWEYVAPLSEELLNEVCQQLSVPEIVEVGEKLRDIHGQKKFASYESSIVFEDAFWKGYLASKVRKNGTNIS